METLNVKIIHPTNNSDIDVGLPNNIFLRDVFSQLIEAGFLAPSQSYQGLLMPSDIRKESINLDNIKTIKENGVNNNDVIQTLAATRAGAGFSINDLGIIDIPNVSFSKMLEQEQSIIMAMNAYKALEEEHKKVIAELNRLKQQNNDRKSAIVLNSVAVVVISIGTAYLTDSLVPAISTIIAGILVMSASIWLAFKKND